MGPTEKYSPPFATISCIAAAVTSFSVTPSRRHASAARMPSVDRRAASRKQAISVSDFTARSLRTRLPTSTLRFGKCVTQRALARG